MNSFIRDYYVEVKGMDLVVTTYFKGTSDLVGTFCAKRYLTHTNDSCPWRDFELGNHVSHALLFHHFSQSHGHDLAYALAQEWREALWNTQFDRRLADQVHVTDLYLNHWMVERLLKQHELAKVCWLKTRLMQPCSN
jgi:hypothetical protein